MMYLRYLLNPKLADLGKNSQQLKFSPADRNSSMLQKREATGIHLNQVKNNVEDNPGQGHVQHEALNNNILAEQLRNKNSKNDDDYYSQDNDNKKDDYYKNDDDYDQHPNDGLEKLHHRMVQFDNGQGEKPKGKSKDRVEYDTKHDDYNEDDDYKLDDKNDEYDGKEDKILKDKDDKNVEVKKDDDRDYPYYDHDHHADHDDYKEEKVQNVQKDSAVPAEVENAEKQAIVINQQKDLVQSTSSPMGSVLFAVVFSIVVVLLLMYRFIRTRRIHIKYKIRSLLHI